MARTILRAGRIAGGVIIAVIILGVVLYWAGVMGVAKTPPPSQDGEIIVDAEAEAAAAKAEADAIAAVEKAIREHMEAKRFAELEAYCNGVLAETVYPAAALCAKDAIVRSYILTGRDVEAEAATAELIGQFGDMPAAARVLCLVGDTWRGKQKAAQAVAAYEQTLALHPGDEFAMWSRQNLCTMALEAGDTVGADDAAARLAADFGGQGHLAMSLCFVGDAYKKAGDLQKAMELYDIAANDHADKPGSVNAQKNICMVYLDQGDQAAADAAAEKLVTGYVKHGHTPFEVCELAARYKKAADWGRAIALYERAARIPGNGNCLFAQRDLCLALLEMKDVERASGESRGMFLDFAEHPRLPFEACLVGDAFLKAKEPAAAMEVYAYVVENYPDNELTLWAQKNICTMHVDAGDEAATSEAIEKLKREFKPKDMVAVALMQIADKCRDAKKYDRAVQIYQDVKAGYADTPSYIWACQNLVRIEIEYDEAAADSTETPASVLQAVDGFMADFAAAPKMTSALCLLGEVYYKGALAKERAGQRDEASVRFGKALPLFAKVISQAPFDPVFTPDAWYMSAVAYSRLGDYAKAIEYHQRIVDDWPEHHLAWSSQYWIGAFYQRLKKNKSLPPAEADAKTEQAFLDLFQDYPDSPMTKGAKSQLAMLYYKTSAWEKAAALYEELFAESPPGEKLPIDVFYLGQAYEFMGHKAMAALTYSEFAKDREGTAWGERASAALARVEGSGI